jgi:hypothetical protein
LTAMFTRPIKLFENADLPIYLDEEN